MTTPSSRIPSLPARVEDLEHPLPDKKLVRS